MGQKFTNALECAKKVSKGILFIIVATVVYNPVVGLIWVLIHPSSAVDCLEGATNRNEPAWWYVRVWGLIDFMFAYLMPWKVRREVLKKFSCFVYRNDEIRGYEEGWIKASDLSSRSRTRVWTSSMEGKLS